MNQNFTAETAQVIVVWALAVLATQLITGDEQIPEAIRMGIELALEIAFTLVLRWTKAFFLIDNRFKPAHWYPRWDVQPQDA